MDLFSFFFSNEVFGIWLEYVGVLGVWIMFLDFERRDFLVRD